MSDEKSGQSGGIVFHGNVGSIGGDVVGQDKKTATTTVNVTTTATTTNTGIDPGRLMILLKQFEKITKRIDELPDDPNVDKDELRETVTKIQDEVKKGDQANTTKVERWLKFIADMSDDILSVTVKALTNPAAGVAEAIRLIAQKAKESK